MNEKIGQGVVVEKVCVGGGTWAGTLQVVCALLLIARCACVHHALYVLIFSAFG